MAKLRCQAVIYVRDTYRRTGRGRSGFEMHYNRQQCSRAAREGGLCYQHAAQAVSGRSVPTYGYLAREFVG